MNILAQSNAWDGVAVGEQLYYFSPMIALVCTMLAVVACPIILGRGTKTVTTVVVIGLIVTFVLALRLAGGMMDGGISGLSTQPLDAMLIADHLSIGFQIVLLLFLGAILCLWWTGSANTERNAPEFFILLLGSALGMSLMVSSLNMLMIIIAIEAASLPSYAIVGFDKRDRIGAEASLKYMIFGAISAAIMIYGASLLYGLVGSLGMADVARYTVDHLGMGQNSVLLSVGLICFFSGIAFKISAVPFHFWCPDAFEGAKIEVTTWLSVASKAAGLVLLVRLVLVICDSVGTPTEMSLVRPLAWAIGMVAAVTCTVGNFSAYKQQSVKRLLAYSSIAHAGYMMMAAAVFIHPDIPGHSSGLTAMLVYLVIYVFMNLGAFGVTAIVTWETGSDKIEAFTGLMRRAPWAAIPMVICLVSLVGIPPMAGFMGKWWILLALGGLQDAGGPHGVASLGTLGWVLVTVVVANTLFSLFYYMRVVVQMALRDNDEPAMRVPLGGLAIVNICAVALLALFVFAEPLKNGVQEFTTGLYRATASASDPAVATALEELIDTRND